MARTPRSLLVATVLAASLATALAGCGTKRVEQSTASSSTISVTASAPEIIPPTPSANDFVSAIMFTKIAGSADLAVEAVTSVGGIDRRLEGDGSGAVGSGFADMTWVSDSGSERELVNDEGIFLQTDGPAGRWTKLADGEITPTTGFADPIRGLGAMSDVTEEGAETIDDVAATRYSGTLPVDVDALRAMGLSEEEVASLGDSWVGAVIVATVWLDATNRVIRVERALDLGEASPVRVTAFTATDISDYGKSIILKSPPDESVTTATAAT
jgi:hypothetical protein